jgi:hypothetical protein
MTGARDQDLVRMRKVVKMRLCWTRLGRPLTRPMPLLYFVRATNSTGSSTRSEPGGTQARWDGRRAAG